MWCFTASEVHFDAQQVGEVWLKMEFAGSDDGVEKLSGSRGLSKSR